MSEQSEDVGVLIAVYESEASAEATMDQLTSMSKAGTIELLDAAIVTREAADKVSVHDIADQHKIGAGRGAIIGGVLGVIFPPSIIGTAIVGGAAGGLYHHFRDKGFSNKELENAGQQLQPGQSALVAVARDRMLERLSQD